MSLDACAALVAKGDPDRFATLMAAPVPMRARLLPLYAFNLEVARAPWVTSEPMIAEMRLQWWADLAEQIGQGRAPAHEVATPLAALVTEARLPVSLLDAMVEARRRDIYNERPNNAEFDSYLDATAGNLMWLSALALGAGPELEARVRAVAWGQGLASLLQAVPELVARGRHPLPHDDISALAQDGLRRLRQGRFPRKIAPALWPAWQAKGLLRLAQAEPQRVAEGRLALPEIRKRGTLLLRSVLG
ncbi:phytoene/squalene synthase family protein [Falsirhodobacter deserti]|uniref:phytoene/squalene synthase family protein n=1 Tax=Falsirhodobacter deserti TaxID=1365611 RepID=UPI000FE438DF|nr:squalene/phytoene synthase family protein [Falsirhodobacter deserti]